MSKSFTKNTGLAALATVALGVAACATANAPPPQTAKTETTPPATSTPAATTAATPDPTTAPSPTPTTSTPPTPTASAPEPPPPQPAFVDTPHPPAADKPHMIKFSVADGRPAGLHSGAPESFWIWHDLKGTHWHLRSTTASQLHRFSGWVIPDGGKFTELKPNRMEWNDRIKGSDKGIHFDFHTKGHEDGFDFKVSGNQCVRFYMFIDGKKDAKHVKVGAGGTHPPAHHFKLCP